jgi:hypothetical protein
MSGSIEAPRKHGPFDPRWLSRRIDGSVVDSLLPAAEVAEALDWYAFSARYFDGQRRHHLRAVSAYAAYRCGREWRKSGLLGPPRLRLVPYDPVPPAIEAESELAAAAWLLPAAAAAAQISEGHGGLSLVRPSH